MGVLLAVFLPVFLFSVLFTVFVLSYSTRRVFGTRKIDDRTPVKCYTTPYPITEAKIAGSRVCLTVEVRASKDTEGLQSYVVRWDKIYSVLSKKKGGKTVLHGCCGQVKPKELAAIVGPSGAGKTVLLDTLAMRRPASSGVITVDGRVLPARVFKQISTYIQQDDAFVPTLSVVETLQLHASLRLPRSLVKGSREGAIRELLRDMGLQQVQHSQVGGLLPGGLVVRGLSGGEKRRLSIACGVVAQPAIIFADEPTSGLDSHAALVVMEHLRGLCAEGRTVICSIHQPRQAIWDMFDVVEVLSEGRLMYFGPKAQALQWFTVHLGYNYNPQHNGSHADWLLDVVSVNFHERSTAVRDRMLSEEEVIQASDRFKEERLPVNLDCEACQPSTSGRMLSEPRNLYPTTWWTQFRILAWRALLAYTRNPADVAGRMMMAQGVAIMDGVVIMSGGNHGALTVSNAVSVVTCIFTLTFTLLLLPFTHMSLYVSDRKFYALDIAANLYAPSAYYFAQAVAGAPFTLLNATTLTLVMYGLIGLRDSPRAILLTVVTVGLLSLIGVQILVLSAYLTNSQDLAFVVAVTYVVWSVLLGGFVVRLSELFTVLRGLSYLFPLRYTFQALNKLQFEGLPTMKVITDLYDMDWSVGANLAGLLCVLVGLHLLSIIALHLLHQPQQRRILSCVAVRPVPSRTGSEYLDARGLSIEVLKDTMESDPQMK